MTEFTPNRIRPRPGFSGGYPPGQLADIERAAAVVEMHDAGLTFATIGAKLTISRARAHAIYKKAKAGTAVDNRPASPLGCQPS